MKVNKLLFNLNILMSLSHRKITRVTV